MTSAPQQDSGWSRNLTWESFLLIRSGTAGGFQTELSNRSTDWLWSWLQLYEASGSASLRLPSLLVGVLPDGEVERLLDSEFESARWDIGESGCLGPIFDRKSFAIANSRFCLAMIHVPQINSLRSSPIGRPPSAQRRPGAIPMANADQGAVRRLARHGLAANAGWRSSCPSSQAISMLSPPGRSLWACFFVGCRPGLAAGRRRRCSGQRYWVFTVRPRFAARCDA